MVSFLLTMLAVLVVPQCDAFLPPRVLGRASFTRISTTKRATAQGSTSEVDDAVEEKLAAALAQDILTQPPAEPSDVL